MYLPHINHRAGPHLTLVKPLPQGLDSQGRYATRIAQVLHEAQAYADTEPPEVRPAECCTEVGAEQTCARRHHLPVWLVLLTSAASIVGIIVTVAVNL